MLYTMCAVFSFLIQITSSLKVKKLSLTMPYVHPNTRDSTFCTSRRLNSTIYIVAFEPKATTDMVHHLLVFVCSNPGSTKTYWNCGETSHSKKPNKATPCANDDLHIIYAWALNARSFQLPKNIAFQVGKKAHLEYLVLQIHYAHHFVTPDHSGLNIVYTKQPQSKLAGLLLLAAEGAIPPRRITHLETQCEVRKNKTLFPFAYRVHTHDLGKLVSGYHVHKDGKGVDRWFLLGRKNPQEEQMFYPVVNKKPVVFKDKLVARCTMDARGKDGYTFVGARHHDEMCNFYVMYYVEKGKPLEMSYCV